MDESAARRAHEPSHPSLRAAIAAVAVILAGIAAALAAATVVSSRVPSPRNAPNNADPPQIEGPVQRTAPARERHALLEEKRARLASSGVDAATGKRHIPIDEAMRVLVEESAGR